MDFIYKLLTPISYIISWIMYGFHKAWSFLGLESNPGMTEAQANTIVGWNWTLSIVGLVIVMRILLIPLFVRQIRSSRALQLIQPQMQKIQAKYKGKTDPISRQAQQEEMMALYKDAGTNPMSSCLPILLQSPIFFALFYVLRSLKDIAQGKDGLEIGPITQEVAMDFHTSTLFGAPLSSTFMSSAEYGSASATIKVVTVVLIICMSATQFYTQRQLTMKNMPASALDNPMAKQQKMLMYMMPLIFAFSGINFPIGVLIYWFVTNVWSMGQQFYVIRRMPAPGSEAEKRMLAKKRAKAERRGEVIEGAVVTETVQRGQRVQPVSKKRAKGGSVNPLAGTRGTTADKTGTGKKLGNADSDAPQDSESSESSGTTKKTSADASTPIDSSPTKKANSSSGQRQQPSKKRKKKK